MMEAGGADGGTDQLPGMSGFAGSKVARFGTCVRMPSATHLAQQPGAEGIEIVEYFGAIYDRSGT